MTWVKLDDQFFTHRKVVNLSKDAKLLFLAATALSATNLLDGILTRVEMRIACATVDTCDRAVDELVAAGLFERDGDDIHIHDYLEYNPTRDHVLSERAAARDRMKRIRSPERSPERSGEVRKKFGDPEPVPEPEPEPEPEPSRRHPSRARDPLATSAAWTTTPDLTTTTDLDGGCDRVRIADLLASRGVAVRTAAALTGQFDPDRILRNVRWVDASGHSGEPGYLVAAVRADYAAERSGDQSAPRRVTQQQQRGIDERRPPGARVS